MRPEGGKLLRFRQAKQSEIEHLESLAARGCLPRPLAGERPSFTGALRRKPFAVIAEYKRASPSQGLIRSDLEPETVAGDYARGGASCLSVLTEEAFFRGNLAFLSRMAAPGLPLLRKDFLFHPLQVEATAATPASALLLIVRLTPDVRLLRSLREQAEGHGLEAVVEVFDAEDLHLARESGARTIQVNARDLETLNTDRQACLDLIRHHPPQAGEIWIAASGLTQRDHLESARMAGFQAALVGTSLMRHPSPGEALAALLAGPEAAADHSERA